MIVYNVASRWFTMKNDGEAYRRAEGLPKAALYTLTIKDRDDLAALLNGLRAPEGNAPVEPVEVLVDRGTERVPPEVIERNTYRVVAPDFVPAFLLRDKH